MTRKLDIDWAELEIAFESSDFEMGYYLDRETGAVVLVTGDLRREAEQSLEAEGDEEEMEDEDEDVLASSPEDLELARATSENPDRYLAIPGQDSHEGYRDMEDFAATLGDTELARLLGVALRGRGAFGRFKSVLADHRAERQRWFAFRDERLRERILDWLEAEGITPARLPEPRKVPEPPGPQEVPEAPPLSGPRAVSGPRDHPDSLERPDAAGAPAGAQDRLLADLTLLSLFLSSWEESAGGTPVRRAWKGHLFEVLDALEKEGLIAQSRGAKSLLLTEEGLRGARALEERYAARQPTPEPDGSPRKRRRGPARDHGDPSMSH